MKETLLEEFMESSSGDCLDKETDFAWLPLRKGKYIDKEPEVDTTTDICSNTITKIRAPFIIWNMRIMEWME